MKPLPYMFLFLPLLLAQTNPSDVLEQALGRIVTVVVYQNHATGNRPLGVRGDDGLNVTAAYARAPNLSGARGSGSGFVVEQDGQKFVLTNAHVVKSSAETASSLVVFSVNQKKYEVCVVGGDALYDFAVLAFVTPPGFVQRAYLGLEIAQVTRFVQRPEPQTTPPVLSAMLPESPAKAALSSRVGQRIVAVNRDEVRSVEEVLGSFENSRPGSTVSLTFQPEGGTAETVTVKAGTMGSPQLESISRYVLMSNRLI